MGHDFILALHGQFGNFENVLRSPVSRQYK